MSEFKNQKSGSFYKKLKHFMLPIIILLAGGGSLVVLMAMKKRTGTESETSGPGSTSGFDSACGIDGCRVYGDR